MNLQTQAAIRASFHKALPALLVGCDPEPLVWDHNGVLTAWDALPISHKRYWTPEEDAVLRTCYATAPKGRRFRAIHLKLPHRTKDAVVSRARYIGLTGYRTAKRELSA